MKIVFDDAEPGDDFCAVQAEKPAVFRFTGKVAGHTFEVGLGWGVPLFVEPLSGIVEKFRFIPECQKGKGI